MPKITALELAKLIVSQVNYALSIGASNLSTSDSKSGNWASKVVKASRHNYDGSFIWKKETQTKKWSLEKDSRKKPYELLQDKSWCLGHIVAVAPYPINDALYASISKTGNCAEMSCLAMIYLCRYASKHFDKKDKFFFEIIDTEMDHLMVKITLNGQAAICDPWINHACRINSACEVGVKRSYEPTYRMNDYFDLLKEEGIDDDDDDDEDLDQWEILDNELCDDTEDLVKYTIDELNDARIVLKHYEKTFENYLSALKDLKQTRAPMLFSYKPTNERLCEKKAMLKHCEPKESHQIPTLFLYTPDDCDLSQEKQALKHTTTTVSQEIKVFTP